MCKCHSCGAVEEDPVLLDSYDSDIPVIISVDSSGSGVVSVGLHFLYTLYIYTVLFDCPTKHQYIKSMRFHAMPTRTIRHCVPFPLLAQDSPHAEDRGFTWRGLLYRTSSLGALSIGVTIATVGRAKKVQHIKSLHDH